MIQLHQNQNTPTNLSPFLVYTTTVPNIHYHYTLNTIYIETSMNWRVYTSHHIGHFSKRQWLPADCFSPLIEDHAPKYSLCIVSSA